MTNTTKQLASLQSQDVSDIFTACQLHSEEGGNQTFAEMAKSSIGGAIIGSNKPVAERHEAGADQNISEWMSAALVEISKRAA